MNRVAVLVAGMHRSGTSALTRMLVGLGCAAPRTCMAADAHNALGYWESTVIMELNDAILASGGSSWDDWGPFNPAWHASPAAAPFRERALAALESEFGDSPLFVLKDPRTCRLLPFWKQRLQEFGATPCVALPVRNPLEVAASLAHRDHIEEPFGTLLWLRNVLQAEADCRGDQRAFIRYDDLLANWEAAAERMARQLSITWPKRSTITALDIDENLPQGLKHQVRTDADVSGAPGVAEWVKSAYAILARWARDDARKADTASLDATRAALDEAEAAFRRPIVLGARARQREVRLEGELAERRQEVEALATQLAAKDGRLASLGETLTEKDVRIDALEHAVQGRDGQIADRDARLASLGEALAERDGQISAKNAQVAAKDGELASLGKVLAEKDVRIDALEHAVRSRDGQIADRDARVAAKDGELVGLGEALTEREARIDALEQVVRDRDGQVADRDARLTAKDGELASLGEALTERDVRLDAMDHALRARDGQLQEFAEAQAQADAQTRRLALEVEAFRTSTFWRITWPMRAAITGTRWAIRALGAMMLFPARLAWRLLPLGDARRNSVVEAVRRLLPERFAKRDAEGDAQYVQAGRLDLAEQNYRAAQGKGPVPILFDADWYLANNEDVKLAGDDPLRHYLECGAAEGRLPVAIARDAIDPMIESLHRLNLEHPTAFQFDAAFYQALHPDLAALDEGALAEHYEAHGRAEARVGSKGEFVSEICRHAAEIPLDFHADEYIDLYPDLIVFREQPAVAALRHYMLYGRWEPRLHTLRGDAAPPARLEAKQPPPAGRRSLCVLVHVYYPELWPELASYIQKLPEEAYDLYVNLVDATFSQASLTNIRATFPSARVYISENLGRDIGGYFQLLKNLRMEDYDIFCLLHTKRSPHMARGEVQRWRRKLLLPLLGSPERALENIELMRDDSAIGQIGAAACRYTKLNDNAEKYLDALRRLGIDEDTTAVEFLAGTMMFVRGEVLARVFEGLRDVPFEVGDGASLAFHVDGQWAHSVERAIGAVVRDMGYRFEWR